MPNCRGVVTTHPWVLHLKDFASIIKEKDCYFDESAEAVFNMSNVVDLSPIQEANYGLNNQIAKDYLLWKGMTKEQIQKAAIMFSHPSGL